MLLQGHRASYWFCQERHVYISCVIAGAASKAGSGQVDIDELPADSPEAAAELLMDLKRVVIAPGKFAQG